MELPQSKHPPLGVGQGSIDWDFNGRAEVVELGALWDSGNGDDGGVGRVAGVSSDVDGGLAPSEGACVVGLGVEGVPVCWTIDAVVAKLLGKGGKGEGDEEERA